MNTIKDGCCIIDALCGIDTASPQVGQFTDNFTKIKFIIKKNLEDYNILLLTDTDGQVDFVTPDDTVLIKDITPDTNETTLLWNIGREITSKSTVVIYQIVAYKGNIDNPESTWYSKEGRLTVTESIDSSSKSASVIGTYPNLLTRLILNVEKCKENYNSLSDTKVDKEDGKELSANDFTNELKEKLEGIEEGAEKNVNPDWMETDSSKDSYIENKPSNFGSVLFVNEDMTTFEFKGDDMPVTFVQGHGIDFKIQNRPDERSVSISSAIDNEYNSQSDLPQSGKAVKEAISLAIASLADSAPETLDTLKEIADALNNDPDFGASIITELSKKANSKDLSKVATSGSYEDLSDKPTILSEDDVINIHSNHTYPVMRAEADANWNKIHLTYATIAQINKILNGQSIVGRAENDDLGDKIRLTYAKKTDIVTSYNDLTDKPFSNVNWLDIDSLYGREKDGIYKVSGKEMSGTVGMGNSSSYMLVMTNVSGNVLQTCQYLIHSDGKSQYRLGTGTGIEDWSEWKSVGVTSYNDLTDKPLIKPGEGIDSLQQSTTQALTDYSIALGDNNISGCKAFYIKTIDFENKYIYLSEAKANTTIGVGSVNSSFRSPDYTIGSSFSVIVKDTSTSRNHYHLCATIKDVTNNRISYEGDLPFGTILNEDNERSNTFFVPSQPEIGTVTIFTGAHSEGRDNKSTGNASHAEGRETRAVGDYSHTEGRETVAGYAAHAEGENTTALGYDSHAEGQQTMAVGKAAHAEGYGTTAKGDRSHAEGNDTYSGGENSHAEGYKTQAYGKNAHAEGLGALTNSAEQHAQGRWNLPMNNTYAHILGNGTEDNRSNAHTVKWNGDAWYAGKITVGEDNAELATENYVDSCIGDVETSLEKVLAKYGLDGDVQEALENIIVKYGLEGDYV